MGTYKVELFLDGYGSEQEANEAGFEYIYEALNSAGSCVKVSDFASTQYVRLSKIQVEQLLDHLNNAPDATSVDVSQYTTGIGLVTSARVHDLLDNVSEKHDITDFKSW